MPSSVCYVRFRLDEALIEHALDELEILVSAVEVSGPTPARSTYHIHTPHPRCSRCLSRSEVRSFGSGTNHHCRRCVGVEMVAALAFQLPVGMSHFCANTQVLALPIQVQVLDMEAEETSE